MCTAHTRPHARTHTPTFIYSHSNLLQKPALRGLICASVPSLVKFKRVNKSLPPEQPSSSPFHVHICSLYVQKSTEARPDSVGIGLAEELEAFQLLASVVPLPRAAGSQLMAMLGTQRERTVADFPIAVAPIPAQHQLQMSHQQLETFGLMLRFSESSGQMFLTFCVSSHSSTLSSFSFHSGCHLAFRNVTFWVTWWKRQHDLKAHLNTWRYTRLNARLLRVTVLVLQSTSYFFRVLLLMTNTS